MSYRTKLYLGCHYPCTTWFCYNILHRVGYLAPIFLCCILFPIPRPMLQCRSCVQFWARETDSETVGFDIQYPVLFPIWFTTEVQVGWTYNRIFLSTSVACPSPPVCHQNDAGWRARTTVLSIEKISFTLSSSSQNRKRSNGIDSFWRPLPLKVLEKSRARGREKKNVPPSFPWSVLLLIIVHDQSTLEKSLSYCKNAERQRMNLSNPIT